MSARRFYFSTVAPAVSPSADAGWEVVSGIVRGTLVPKLKLSAIEALTNTAAITVPITTTQDILGFQFVSEPLRAQTLLASCTFSLVVRVFESATTANVMLAVVVRVVSQDGGTVRGTLFSNFNTGTEFAVSASAATRIVSATAVTSLQIQDGDRIVVEVGGHAAAPTAAGSYTMRFGSSAATDFALTAALTTDLNPWCEFSEDVLTLSLNNGQTVRAGDGMSTNERIR